MAPIFCSSDGCAHDNVSRLCGFRLCQKFTHYHFFAENGCELQQGTAFIVHQLIGIHFALFPLGVECIIGLYLMTVILFLAQDDSAARLGELDGVAEDVAKEAMRLASHKLPIKCKFVVRSAAESEEVSE